MAIVEKKMTQREINAQKTKRKVLETSLQLFTTHGYDSVTIDDIVKKAGVSKGTFYTHFSSKDRVLVESFNSIDGVFEEAMEALPDDTSASDQLRVLFKTLFEYCSNFQDVDIMKIVYMNQISLGERQVLLKDHNRPHYKYLDKIVKLGVATEEFHFSVDAETLIEYFFIFSFGLTYNWCLEDGKKDLVQTGSVFVDQLIEWLSGPVKKMPF